MRVAKSAPKSRNSDGGRSAANTTCRDSRNRRVQRVQQLDHRRLLARKELHIIDNQQVDGAVLLAKTGQAAAPQRLQEIGRELLGR